ncbi:MAG: bdcA 2 [Xanthobacteraceae bacterium]|jgi:NAD(P)-dependent dehydrogenase (short-subunit alcohol dehydrogenase family)|nr:bdcA 2 [Xanthobacteraceae bacterium]
MLEGRVALVTGGSRGIGAGIVEALAAAGADVAFTYKSSVDGAETVRRRVEAMGRRAVAIRADSAVPSEVVAAVDAARERLGGLDILVNNAGTFPYGAIEDVGLDEVDATLAIHARAAFVASQAALRHMDENGRIISIGSCLAERVPAPGMALYAMSKAALVGFTKGLARDVGGRNITVNLVEPGSTDTDMNPAEGPSADGERALTALGRYAKPAEIAATVAFLAGPGGAYITGARIPVDGGYTA